jgi:hypothetical protein
VACQTQCRLIVAERHWQVAASLIDLGHTADGREVVRGGFENEVELPFGVVELANFHQRASERDAC